MALILVVDDEPDLLALLVEQLQALGHEVMTAQDGAAGLPGGDRTPRRTCC